MESRLGYRHPANKGGSKNFHQSDKRSAASWERLAHLKLMSLQYRRERHIILMMWKDSSQFRPKFLNCRHIEFKMTSRHGTIAIIPPLAKSNSSYSNQTL